MKNLIFAVALLSILFLSACSNTDQDPISSNASQIEKIDVADISQPFDLYQTFPELITSKISWRNERGGIVITIDNLSDIKIRKFLFAIIESANNRGTVMAYLGNSHSARYYLNDFNERDIRSIRVFYFEETTGVKDINLPYSKSDLFKNLTIRRWEDGGTAVKINSFPFPADMNHLFAQMIGSEVSQLIFLGKPRSEDFEFPKSEKFRLEDVKLFTYIK